MQTSKVKWKMLTGIEKPNVLSQRASNIKHNLSETEKMHFWFFTFLAFSTISTSWFSDWLNQKRHQGGGLECPGPQFASISFLSVFSSSSKNMLNSWYLVSILAVLFGVLIVLVRELGVITHFHHYKTIWKRKIFL